jgi:hypothetical protein
MAGLHLAVDEPQRFGLQHAVEQQQRDFGRIWDVAKHRFTEQDPADDNPVQATNECVLLPDFD